MSPLEGNPRPSRVGRKSENLRIILYSDYVGYIADFDVIFKEPWYFSEVHLKCLFGECGFLYLDSFIWRIVTGSIEVKPFIKVTRL